MPYGVIIWLSAVLLSGCLAAGQNVFYPAPLFHERFYSYTSFDSERTAAVGESMVFKIDGWAAPGFTAANVYQPDPDLNEALDFAPIEPGSEWILIGRIGTGDLVIRNPVYPRPMRQAFPVPWDMCIVVAADGELYGYAHCHDPAVVHPWRRKPANFLRKKNRIFTKGTVKQEFVYHGREKNKLFLSYREYRDDLKKPVLTRNIVLDFWQERVISHKGMHIEVFEANDDFIRFAVRTPFDLWSDR